MENLRTDCCCKNYYRAITFIMADSERGVLIGSLWSETEDLSSVLICWGISQHTYCCAYRLIILLVVLSLIQSGVYSSDHRTKRMPLSMQAGRAQCFYACEPIPNRRSALLLTDCHYTEHRHPAANILPARPPYVEICLRFSASLMRVIGCESLQKPSLIASIYYATL